MKEHDVIRAMGRFPDEIIYNAEEWKSKKWKCGRCEKTFVFDEEMPNPAPCNECGGIAFEKIAKSGVE